MKRVKSLRPFWGVVLVGVVLLVGLGFLIVGALGAFDQGEERYNEVRSKIMTVIFSFSVPVSDDHYWGHLGQYIVTGETMSLEEPAGEYYIIDICGMFGGEWSSIPEGLYGSAGQAGTNFASGNCSNTPAGSGSYIWLLDFQGADSSTALSTCIGDRCEANGADGYQGVWP